MKLCGITKFFIDEFLYNRNSMYDYLTRLQVHYDNNTTNRYISSFGIFTISFVVCFCLKVKCEIRYGYALFCFNLLIASQLL